MPRTSHSSASSPCSRCDERPLAPPAFARRPRRPRDRPLPPSPAGGARRACTSWARRSPRGVLLLFLGLVAVPRLGSDADRQASGGGGASGAALDRESEPRPGAVASPRSPPAAARAPLAPPPPPPALGFLRWRARRDELEDVADGVIRVTEHGRRLRAVVLGDLRPPECERRRAHAALPAAGLQVRSPDLSRSPACASAPSARSTSPACGCPRAIASPTRAPSVRASARLARAETLWLRPGCARSCGARRAGWRSPGVTSGAPTTAPASQP